mmetsp:Transcript_27162/g.67943  ORF Transcript_27162/g.67943 Transcript_27162/m.67943 type:complete len:365 (-) Transcript_27162:417-1511(-)
MTLASAMQLSHAGAARATPTPGSLNPKPCTAPASAGHSCLGSRPLRSCRRPRCAAAGRDGAGDVNGDEEPTRFEGRVIANNAASVNGKLRTLVVGVTDARGSPSLNHRKASAGTLFKQQQWVDGFETPGQYIILTDIDSGKAIRKPISVSPYHARSTAPGTDVTVVEVLLDTNSPDGDENFFASAQPPTQLSVSPVKGCGFENPLFPEYNLGSAIARGHAVVLVAGGSAGLGPLRAAMEWPNLSSHADKHPVTLFYMRAGDQESAAYIQEWDQWREGGAKVVPCYGDLEQDVFKMQQTLVTGGAEFGGKFDTVLGRYPSDVTVLVAGLTGEEMKSVLQIFSTNRKVPKQQILVMPDFAIKKKKL